MLSIHKEKIILLKKERAELCNDKYEAEQAYNIFIDIPSEEAEVKVCRTKLTFINGQIQKIDDKIKRLELASMEFEVCNCGRKAIRLISQGRYGILKTCVKCAEKGGGLIDYQCKSCYEQVISVEIGYLWDNKYYCERCYRRTCEEYKVKG